MTTADDFNLPPHVVTPPPPPPPPPQPKAVTYTVTSKQSVADLAHALHTTPDKIVVKGPVTLHLLVGP